MTVALVLATGFAQPRKISNGMRKIKNALPVGVLWELHSYKEHEEIPEVAARIAVCKRLVFVGHSWGTWYLNLLAAELDGMASVGDLFLADPVTRPPGGTLTIPLNVNRLHVWSKRDGAIPTAEIVIPDGSMTQLATNEVVDVGHAKVDDLKEFRAAVLTAVKGTP
jgi:hypothetical protein